MSAQLDTIHADLLQPFTLQNSAVRGRLVRLGTVVDTILSRHNYPDVVSRVLGELLVVASMLSFNLKHEGIFTLQLRGNGPVPMLVVDAVFGGELRGYAQLAEGAEEAIAALGTRSTPKQLFGDDSYLAITLDPGRGMNRYQGVVALEGATISDALAEYFTHSQQLDVWFALACNRLGEGGKEGGHWAAGGLMLERVADSGGIQPPDNTTTTPTDAESHELWNTILALSKTVQAAELLDVNLELSDLLYRLYHEQDARITPPAPLTVGCRCSRERIFDLLMSMSTEDRADMIVNGSASVNCQFCNKAEHFSPQELGLASLQ